MKLVLKALTLAVFTFLLAGQFGAQAQGGGGFMANRVMGAVTTVDTTGNTITVQGRGQNATATTVKVNSDTKYTHPVPAAITDIAVGSPITVRSATPPQPGDTTADATSITVLDALPPAPPAGAPAGGFGGRGGRGGTTGTVVTLTPSLTIKTAAGANHNYDQRDNHLFPDQIGDAFRYCCRQQRHDYNHNRCIR